MSLRDLPPLTKEEVSELVAEDVGQNQSTLDQSSRARSLVPWMEAFLTELAKRGNITEACRKGNVSRGTAKNHRAANATFAAAWEAAEQEALDRVEARGHQMATDGLRKEIYHQGIVVGEEYEVDAGMVRFFLERRRRDKFGEKIDINITGQIAHLHASPEDLRKLVQANHPELFGPAKELPDSQT